MAMKPLTIDDTMPQKNGAAEAVRDAAVAEHLEALVEHRPARDRDAHEERDLGGRRPVESQPPAHRDRRARARHARRQRECLGRAHQHRVATVEVASVAIAGRPSAHWSTRANRIRLIPMRIGSPRLSSMTLVNSAPMIAPGDRGEQEQPREPLVDGRDRPSPERVPGRHDVRPHLEPEVARAPRSACRRAARRRRSCSASRST